MNERIKAARKAAGLKQAELAERLGLKTNTVTSYETGVRVPSDAVILSICRELGVSEHWLRTGEGSMLVELSEQKKIAAFLGDLMRDEEDGSFKRRLIEALSEMSPDEWELLEKLARKLTGG